MRNDCPPLCAVPDRGAAPQPGRTALSTPSTSSSHTGRPIRAYTLVIASPPAPTRHPWAATVSTRHPVAGGGTSGGCSAVVRLSIVGYVRPTRSEASAKGWRALDRGTEPASSEHG